MWTVTVSMVFIWVRATPDATLIRAVRKTKKVLTRDTDACSPLRASLELNYLTQHRERWQCLNMPVSVYEIQNEQSEAA
jgi:hypothetical protein